MFSPSPMVGWWLAFARTAVFPVLPIWPAFANDLRTFFIQWSAGANRYRAPDSARAHGAASLHRQLATEQRKNGRRCGRLRNDRALRLRARLGRFGWARPSARADTRLRASRGSTPSDVFARVIYCPDMYVSPA